MVFARYVMFSEVYWHHGVRSATSMFARAFYELRHRLDLNAFFQGSEFEAIAGAYEPSWRGPDASRFWRASSVRSAGFINASPNSACTRCPKPIDCLASRPCNYLMACAETLAEQLSVSLGERIGGVDILIDAPPPHREIEFDVEIYYPKEDVYRPLHQVSPVVDALARTQFDDYVKRVRIFAHPRVAGRIAASNQFPTCLAAAISETP